MFLTLLLYKKLWKENHIYPLCWEGDLSERQQPSTCLYITAKVKVNTRKYMHFRVGALEKEEHAQPHSWSHTSFQKLWLLTLNYPWIVHSTQGLLHGPSSSQGL